MMCPYLPQSLKPQYYHWCKYKKHTQKINKNSVIVHVRKTGLLQKKSAIR